MEQKNRFITANYQLYTVADGKKELEEQTSEEHPFQFITGFGVSLDAFEQQLIEKESGATVHYVDEGVDTGQIILQEKVPVLPGDDPQTLRERVLEIEHKILPEAIAMIEKARH